MDEEKMDANRDDTSRVPVDTGNDSFEDANPILPFSRWWPFLAGALVGVVLRLIFSGKPDDLLHAMDGIFIYLVPIIVGAVTVYVAETQKRRSWSYYIWTPMAANAIFVIGTLLIMIEGLICAILIVPLFAVLGVVGGLIMGIVCRTTHWPKHATYCLVALPVILGALLPSERESRHIGTSKRTLTIRAPAEAIWRQIHDVRDIKPEEVNSGWIYHIGVPLPIAGVTEETPAGLVRKISMGKAIHFEQVVTDWQENRFVRWTYRFSEDSFPAGALDDHVKIGGHYFDMIDTSYELTPIDNQFTNLTIHMSYRVSTQFNWYADSIAQLLIGNFEEVILNFYSNRAIRNNPT
jgi:hypothetical protein